MSATPNKHATHPGVEIEIASKEKVRISAVLVDALYIPPIGGLPCAATVKINNTPRRVAVHAVYAEAIGYVDVYATCGEEQLCKTMYVGDLVSIESPTKIKEVLEGLITGLNAQFKMLDAEPIETGELPRTTTIEYVLDRRGL